MTGSLKKIPALLILVAWACAVPRDCLSFDQSSVAGARTIPTPAETPAKVIVNGRSSTAQDILIRDLGDHIPPTFSGDRVKNTEGFTWYVSQHYALKTDFRAERAKHYLTVLELAYPQLVQMFGREPTGIDQKRMAIVYAKDKQTLAQALASDGHSWDFRGGGITFDECSATYQYPSGGLQYHMRYILLHEATHLFQVCLTGNLRSAPGWYNEGVADLLSHHVWEADRQRLTVNVIDKATDINWLDIALRRFYEKRFTAADIARENLRDRDVGFLLVAYFMTDVERSLKFRIYRDELFRLNLYNKYQERSDALIEELFGPWAELDADFTRWVAARRATFHPVEWGWEQDGDILQSYGWPNKGSYSQIDLQISLRDKSSFDPLVLDYPATAADTPLVGPVERGVAEPAVGCLISWRQTPGAGQAGLAFGVEDLSYLKILVDAGNTLILDGTDIGANRLIQLLPMPLVKAIRANGHQVGLTVRLKKEALVVTIRAGSKKEIEIFTAALSLTTSQRQRVLKRPIALLSRGGRHEITPYLDIPHADKPGLASAAPANRWRNPGDPQLYAVYRTAWRLGSSAPTSLLAMRRGLLVAADEAEEVQRKALADFADRLPTVLNEIENGDSPAMARKDALTWLRATISTAH